MNNTFRFLTLVLVIAFSVAFGSSVWAEPPAPAAEAAPAKCVSTPKTDLVKKACERGGQKAAKKAMKGWVKKVKAAKKAAAAEGFKLNCKTCHTKVKGDFPLKDDGRATFKRLDEWLKKQATATQAERHEIAALFSR